jgi:hypothetical protein
MPHVLGICWKRVCTVMKLSKQARGVVLAVVAVALLRPLPAAATPVQVSTSLSYDGSYNPYTSSPPAGQSTWFRGTATINPTVNTQTGVAHCLDASSSARVMIARPFDEAIAGKRWAYEARLNWVSGTASLPWAMFALGVRDEGATGRTAMLGFFDTGVYLVDNSTESKLIKVANNLEGTGYHTYRVVKFWDEQDSEFQVQIYIDNMAKFSSPLDYLALPGQATTSNGFGYFGSTPGVSDVHLDYIQFGPVPEPTTLGLLLLGGLALLRRHQIRQ